jgi:cell division protein ZapA (FtsZ GTPase activity inhibitor)
MRANVKILGREVVLDCAACDARRLADLATALEARLLAIEGDPDVTRRLVLASLQLLDEAQATGAALARSRMEIERLMDLLVDAKLEAEGPEPVDDTRGRVGAVRVAQGSA